MLSYEHQNSTASWSVLEDVAAPAGDPGLIDGASTKSVDFERFVGNCTRFEGLESLLEDKLGTAQGLGPLTDNQ